MLTTATLRQLGIRRLLPLAVLGNLLFLLYYATIGYQLQLHSDSSVMNLLAQEIHDSGRFFPHDWYYANGDLWIAFPQLVILPLLSFFPNGFALHAAASLATAVLVLASAWAAGSLLDMSRPARLTLLLVLAGGISSNMAENLYGQAAYGTLFAWSCLLAWSGWRLLHARGAARWRWAGLFALLVLQVSWSNPSRALAFYLLPLLAALGSVLLPPASAARRRAALLVAALLIAALLAGAALHGMVMRSVGNSGLPPPSWLDFDGMVRNTLGTLRGVLSLLGGLPGAGTPVASLAGGLSAARLLSALALLVLLPWAVLRALRSPRRGARHYFAVYTLATFVLNLLVTLATSVPDMNAPEASARYLVPALLCALVLLSAHAVDEFRWSRPLAVAGLLALLLVGLSGFWNYRWPDGPAYVAPGRVGEHTIYRKIAAYLEQQGLQYGYSSFWSANTMTVFSAGKVRARPIALDSGLPQPVRHLSSARWYEGDNWQGPTFLMLNYDDAAKLDLVRLAALLGQPVRVLDYGGCKIFVYDHNIAAAMPLWDLRHPVPLHVPVTASTLHHIGQWLPEQAALQSQPGESGHLRYGPVPRPPAGDYLLSVDLETAGAAPSGYGMVDVTDQSGSRVLASQPITTAGRQHLVLPLTIPLLLQDQLEFRVLSNGAGSIILRDFELKRKP